MIVLIYHISQPENIKTQVCKSGWAFLSEHTTSLGEEKYRVDLISDLNRTEKLLLLSQLYVGRLKGRFTVKQKAQKITLIGEVKEIAVKEISLKTPEGYQLVEVEDILDIQLLEEVTYE